MSSVETINLQKQFGTRFRISYDPCYDFKGTHKATRDPWMMQIPCLLGTIYPYSNALLAAEVDYHNPTAKRILALPGAVFHQNGEQEKTLLFPLTVFEEVATILKAKKRRILTAEQKEHLAKIRKPFPNAKLR